MEHHEMTKQEFLDDQLTPRGQRATRKAVGNLTLKKWKLREHETLVHAAFLNGKHVPNRVLVEYTLYPAYAKRGQS